MREAPWSAAACCRFHFASLLAAMHTPCGQKGRHAARKLPLWPRDLARGHALRKRTSRGRPASWPEESGSKLPHSKAPAALQGKLEKQSLRQSRAAPIFEAEQGRSRGVTVVTSYFTVSSDEV